ncbi:PA14 domain-containing protein [Neobacillus sp. LXY-4]|uniref:PA14 domain-containing protein n=1 Tax=Neobacillus sp. LXY-4 TaxID=3379826 RepID=UPI003EDF5E25
MTDLFENLIYRKTFVGIMALQLTLGISSTADAQEAIFQPPKGTVVHYNWGSGSPTGIPADHFTGIFDQSGNYTAGDYFVQTLADDGIKVEADGQWLIDRWSDSGGTIDRALWTGVSALLPHTVKTHYYENVGNASVFSDIVPFDSWVAYYYPNTSLSGIPTAAKVIQPTARKGLSENFGVYSPAVGVPAEKFSARYTTAKRISAGEYILRARADDGIRVYVDGKVVIDRWTDSVFREDAIKLEIADRSLTRQGEQDVHWIEVQYYDSVGEGKVELDLEPYQNAVDDSWLAEFYPNTSLQGTPYVLGGKNSINKISNIDFNWGLGSPHTSIPAERFSARFTKQVNLESGMYLFNAMADDGLRVWVDDQLVIDSWNDSNSGIRSGQISLGSGQHIIKVEYYENVGGASVNVGYQRYTSMPVQIGGTVHYNWGSGSPAGIPADRFTGIFDQSGYYPNGDYFVQTIADDGIKLEADGQWLINRWSDSGGDINRSLWTNVSGLEKHTVKTHYYENVGNASVFSDIVPFDTWVAYYYPNKGLSGVPTAAKVIQPTAQNGLSENFGVYSPAAGVPAEKFSARYTTAKRVAAGEYILRARADDGVRVYVDGKLVIDRWTDSAFREDAIKLGISNNPLAKQGEQDVHWIEVQYFDTVGEGKVELDLEPYQNAIDGAWFAEFYPNTSLQGTPYVVGGKNSINQISKLDFNWGLGSPLASIPAERFSARFVQKVNLESGLYLFNATADDGLRIWVDNQLVIDSWNDSNNGIRSGQISLGSGQHTIKVEYFENVGGASVNVGYQRFANMPVQIGGTVHYNWGSGSPKGVPTDRFTGIFDQSGSYPNRDYFVQTLADDGIKVEADGQWLINRWSDSGGAIDRALWMNVSAADNHTVKTHYYENVGNANVFSDIVPFDSWIAYYYPNMTLSGIPTEAKVIQPTVQNGLSENFGVNAPATGVPTEKFSARYTTAKRIPAGKYILQARADDGIRVYVDGKLVIDRWSDSAFREDEIKLEIADQTQAKQGEQDVHWIEVQYYDNVGDGKVEFNLVSYQTSIDNTWIAEYYPNTSLQGNPIVSGGKYSINPISKLDFNWGLGSPNASVPANYFSARFSKKVNLEAGTYVFSAKADDGIRILVDNKLVLDAWNNSDVLKTKKEAVYLPSGEYTIVVEYSEGYGNANIQVDYQQISPNNIYFSNNEQISFNWGSGGPSSYSPDNFEAVFDQTQTLSGGDYFVQTIADDGIKVTVDGQLKINRWSNSGGQVDQALLLNVPAGEHSILTNYYEDKGNAFVYSNIAKFDTWVASYYSNPSLTGEPVAVKLVEPKDSNKALFENNLAASPVPGVVPADNFSAIYRTAKRINAGEYVLRARVDDGIRILVDGKPILDRWTPNGSTEDAVALTITDNATSNIDEKNVHWIEVQYYEGTGNSNVEVFLQPMNEVVNTDQWVGYLFPNMTLSGKPVILGGNGAQSPLTQLNFNWGTDKPHNLIPADKFSASFIKKAYFNTGNYQIKTIADDGIRVYVDGVLKIDSWVDSAANSKEIIVSLSSGIHEIRVEYYENEVGASLSFDMIQVFATSFKEIDLRTRANITAKEIEYFFDLKKQSNSPIKALAQSFIDAQDKYGVNAQYLVAHAIWETGWGGSNLKTFKNNYFGYGAYDSCPFTCGYYFPTGLDSINYEAYIVRKDYLSENGSYFNGPNLVGMNVRYATDQNWANGIANLMQQMKPFDAGYYAQTPILQGSSVPAPSFGRDIPAGQPYPTSIIINYQDEKYATVVTDGLTFRSLPYTQSSTIKSTLNAGKVVRVLGYNTDVKYVPNDPSAYPYDKLWYRVLVDGQEGWLYGGGISFN